MKLQRNVCHSCKLLQKFLEENKKKKFQRKEKKLKIITK